MALDRFVCFIDEIPTIEQLKFILEDYLSGLGEIDFSDDYCWCIALPGKPSFPFSRIYKSSRHEMFAEERWFEIYIGSLNQENDEGMGPNVDVITRMADELTNTIAKGYAKLIARYFKAHLKE